MAVLMRYPTVVYDELVYAGFGRFFSGTALGLLRRLLPVPRQVLLWAAAITTLLYPPYLL